MQTGMQILSDFNLQQMERETKTMQDTLRQDNLGQFSNHRLFQDNTRIEPKFIQNEYPFHSESLSSAFPRASSDPMFNQAHENQYLTLHDENQNQNFQDEQYHHHLYQEDQYQHHIQDEQNHHDFQAYHNLQQFYNYQDSQHVNQVLFNHSQLSETGNQHYRNQFPDVEENIPNNKSHGSRQFNSQNHSRTSMYHQNTTIPQYNNFVSEYNESNQDKNTSIHISPNSTKVEREDENIPIRKRPSETMSNSYANIHFNRKRSLSAGPSRISLQTDSTLTDSDSQSHRKNRHTIENVRQRIQQELEEKCTFKPNINKKYRSVKQRSNSKDRLELLSQPKDFSNLESQKKELEKSQLKECTFHPKISVKKPKKRSHSSNPEDLVERLVHSHDDRISQREIQKRREEMELAEKFKFRPSLGKESKKLIDESSYRPVYERVGELQKQKYEMLHTLRLKSEEEMKEEFTFKPQVSDRSEEIAKETVKRLPFQQRFVQPLPNERKRAKEDSQEKENFTFHPTVNKISKKILESRQLYGETDFLKRQEILSIQSQQKQNMLRKELNQKYSYKPKVSKSSQFLVETHLDVGSESMNDRIERLVYKDKHRIEMLKEKIHESHYNQFEFKPTINHLSKEMARSLSVEELASIERNIRVKEQAKKRYEKQEHEICTFAPKLLNPELTEKLASKSKFRNNEEMLQDKQKRIEEYRRMQQYKEVKDCTFEPKINKNVKSTGPVIINGLGRHLQRVERAKILKEDQKIREDQVFKVKLNDYQRQLPYTIPEPFNLKHDAIDFEENKRKIRQKWVQHEMSNCTFKPKTNTSIVDFLVYDDL